MHLPLREKRKVISQRQPHSAVKRETLPHIGRNPVLSTCLIAFGKCHLYGVAVTSCLRDAPQNVPSEFIVGQEMRQRKVGCGEEMVVISGPRTGPGPLPSGQPLQNRGLPRSPPWLPLSTALPGVPRPSLAPEGVPGCSGGPCIDVMWVRSQWQEALQRKKVQECRLHGTQAGAKSWVPG